MDVNKKDGKKEDKIKSAAVAVAKKMARSLILCHLNDDDVIAKIKSAAASSSRKGKPPFKPHRHHKILDTTVGEVLQSIIPAENQVIMRQYIITTVTNLISSVKAFEDFSVEGYGSFVSNLYTKLSDVDISILTSSTIEASRNNEQENKILDYIYSEMATSPDSWYNMNHIVSARVPIVKGFTRCFPDIPFDISINNVKGILNSKFFLWIGELDSRFRQLVLLVKEWAKAHDINNSREGTFNSYCLCLLVIFHLQTCVPPILPPLQELYPRNASVDLKGVRRQAEQSIQKIATANIARFKLDSKSNTSSISHLLLTFFEKFSDINDKATELAVCTYTGRWENITDSTRWDLRRRDKLFVEDPFDQPENAARVVKNLDKIARVFRTSSGTLRDSTSRDAILRVLLGQNVSI